MPEELHTPDLAAAVAKLASSQKRLSRTVAALAVVMVAAVALTSYREYQHARAVKETQDEIRGYLMANPMTITPGKDVKQPVKGATFPVYQFSN